MGNFDVRRGLCVVAAALIHSFAAAADSQHPGPMATWLARAAAERRTADTDAEIGSLMRVLELDATHPATHARLAVLSGPAPRTALNRPEAKLRRAMDHPYDPAALLHGGEALAQDGRRGDAIELLEKVVWLADLDPDSALDALLILRETSPEWRARRVVPVHVYADAALRSSAGWRFALRTLWLSASNSLDAVLHTRFVPIAIGRFDPAGHANDLDEMYREFVEKISPPEEGIAAVVTGRRVPSVTDSSGKAVWKKGVAELLGRTLAIRLEPGASQSRVLSHELLHLYGAIHVLDDVESLMNPTSTSLKLDAGSYRIAQAIGARTFGPGGIERNVLSRVDLRRATDAYLDALGTNLAFREAGIADARHQLGFSRERAKQRARQATSLDPHFADAARIVAVLMIADSRRTEALKLLDLAADLYPSDSEKGQQAARDADLLRRDLSRSGSAVADRGL